ncbi:MAG: hypothetical protein GX318_02210 [Clostridia bacterium]|nr:hypothetical protein [Clostridia bacterium]
MRSKALLSIFLILTAAALIGGATMAWFTDDAKLARAELETGTLYIDAELNNIIPMPDREIDNVNPGDCATVCWEIKNTGSKSAEVRVKLEGLWEDGLDAGNVFFAPKPGSGWVMHEDEGQTWLYYTGGPLAGTYGGAEGGTVELCVVVAFDGVLTDCAYQGKEFTFTGTAEAIQATNDAPESQWPGFEEATAPGYNDDHLREYFLTGAGKDMICYHGENDEPPGPSEPKIITMVIERIDHDETASYSYIENPNAGSVTWIKQGVGYYPEYYPAAGYEKVGIYSQVPDDPRNIHQYWLNIGPGAPYVVPDHDVTLYAIFSKIRPNLQ